MELPKIGLEFAFQIRMELGVRKKIGKVPSGSVRGYVAAAGGEITGPMLQGRVVPMSGADWALYRPDNSVHFSARYMLEAADGTWIYMMNTGYRHAPPEIAAKMEALEPVSPDDYYFRVTPTFEAPEGPHYWMTRTIFVGRADRRDDHSIFTYYAVT